MSILTRILAIICVFAIGIIFIVIMVAIAGIFQRWVERVDMDKRFVQILTPTQKFILAASAPTVCNNYKCVIDIWGTHESEAGAAQAKNLFEWGWGEFTYENARDTAQYCVEHGHNRIFLEYCSTGRTESDCTKCKLRILEEAKTKYPAQGFIGWDLVRALSVVGGAYMGGVMEYEEAARVALDVCKQMQENFSSWDDMIGSYTLGYQFWRGKRKTDRLAYYKRLKRASWIYDIAWDTPLSEAEL